MRDLALAALNEELTSFTPLPGPALRPRDAAALILVDFEGPEPKILVGRRNASLRFLPGRFVFPGGALDPPDHHVAVNEELPPEDLSRLRQHMRRPTLARLHGLAVAAVRELGEETGLLLGDAAPAERSPPWRDFRNFGIVPRLDRMRFVARAVTPPGMSRRFDTRFFMADASDVAASCPGVVGPDSELVELCWTTVEEACHLDLHVMTRAVMAELAEGLQSRLERAMPVPFFRVRRGRFVRDYIR